MVASNRAQFDNERYELYACERQCQAFKKAALEVGHRHRASILGLIKDGELWCHVGHDGIGDVIGRSGVDPLALVPSATPGRDTYAR